MSLYKSTAKDTIISGIKIKHGLDVDDSNNKGVYMTDNKITDQDPVVKITFKSNNDAIKFANNYRGIVVVGLLIVLSSAKAQYIFNNIGIGMFGKTNKRPIYDVLKYEVYKKSSATNTNVSKNIDQINIRGQFQEDNENPQKTSGGNEKSLLEIEAAGTIPCHYKDNKVYLLLGFDPHQKQWKYFGGGKETIDTNSRSTAYRETFEETCKETNPNNCYIDLTIIKNGLENGNGLCLPKFNGSTKKWNNFYFIKLDMHKSLEIDVNGIANNEVTKMKWFDLAELETLKSDTYQKTIKLPSGKIHPPIVGIVRDHSNKIRSFLQFISSISIDQKMINLLKEIDMIHSKKNHVSQIHKNFNS